MNWLTPLEVEALLISLKVSIIAVGISVPVGIAIAWILARFQFPGKIVIDGLIHLPLVVPPVVTGYFLLMMFGRNGVFGKPLFEIFNLTLAFDWKGAAIASGVISFPLLVRSIRLSLEGMDRGLETAAYTLGSSPFRVFFTITLPLIIPGIIAGSILAFARSISEFGATITFVSNIPGKTNTLPLTLYNLTQTPDGELGAFRLCVISVITAMVALIGSEYCSRAYHSKLKQ